MIDANFLRQVRSLIEKGWTQLEMARDEHHEPTEGDDAVCWCLLGAGYWVRYELNESIIRFDTRFATALGFSSGTTLTDWNDELLRTKQDVLDRIDAFMPVEG